MIQTAIAREKEEIRQEGFERGIEQGIERGIEQGIDIGKKEGIDIGKRERDRQLARTMLSKGYPLATIADLLGMDEATLHTLLAEE